MSDRCRFDYYVEIVGLMRKYAGMSMSEGKDTLSVLLLAGDLLENLTTKEAELWDRVNNGKPLRGVNTSAAAAAYFSKEVCRLEQELDRHMAIIRELVSTTIDAIETGKEWKVDNIMGHMDEAHRVEEIVSKRVRRMKNKLLNASPVEPL